MADNNPAAPAAAAPAGAGARRLTASRPLSPHLQIWRFTPTMAASITQRATGVANFTGTLVLAAYAVAAASGDGAFAALAGFLASPLGQIVVLGYIWSLSFHLLGGLRYLYTDTGRGLEAGFATRAAIANFAGSVLLTLVIAGGALAARAS